MNIKVNIFGYMKKYSNFKKSKDNYVEISKNTTIKEFLENENLPIKEIFVLVNDKNKNKNLDYILKNNDELIIYPANIGG